MLLLDPIFLVVPLCIWRLRHEDGRLQDSALAAAVIVIVVVFDGGGGLFDCCDCFSFHFVLVLKNMCKSYFQLLLFLLSFTLQSLISLFLLFYNVQIHQSTQSLWR